MPAELSEYEKQRLANIAQNQSVLAQLGLADGECKLKKPPPPKRRPVARKRDDDDEERCWEVGARCAPTSPPTNSF